jgi:hypothetical protein
MYLLMLGSCRNPAVCLHSRLWSTQAHCATAAAPAALAVAAKTFSFESRDSSCSRWGCCTANRNQQRIAEHQVHQLKPRPLLHARLLEQRPTAATAAAPAALLHLDITNSSSLAKAPSQMSDLA